MVPIDWACWMECSHSIVYLVDQRLGWNSTDCIGWIGHIRLIRCIGWIGFIGRIRCIGWIGLIRWIVLID